ncbi:hypothetical protein EVAR_60027_1 [Eumeta japonica]|uniref:Gustatory receptor n=1 Tax=Eumeta variegata TaxID=151549 RepID=A0A4C1ZL34_EUMVA|nr:hypothetical protein EVAR_60027_1 [Eumeta japonica]
MSQNNEFLLNNALAEDFQQMLRPYYWTQKLLFASKYSIKDNFVLPNSRTYCAVNVLVLCFIIYAYFAVLSYIVATFVNILVTLQIVIGWTKSEKTNGIYEHISIIHVLSVAWNTKNFLIIVMFSTSCEKFYSSIDGLKHNCVVVLNSTPEKSVSRNVTKNVLRLCDVRFSKMRVCGWFTADAALPLRLMSLVATYCIVLLQFAFL